MSGGQGSNGGASGGPGGGMGKAAALLAGLLGIGGLIIILSGGGGGGDPAVESTSASQPPTVAAAATMPVSTAVPVAGDLQAAQFDRSQIPQGDDTALVTITAYGMPARVDLQAQENDRQGSGSFVAARGVDVACLPDLQYPDPCVSYIIVKKGATVTVSAGAALAGFWSTLDYVRGGGCDLQAAVVTLLAT